MHHPSYPDHGARSFAKAGWLHCWGWRDQWDSIERWLSPATVTMPGSLSTRAHPPVVLLTSCPLTHLLLGVIMVARLRRLRGYAGVTVRVHCGGGANFCGARCSAPGVRLR
jgi:hypothetical protein